MKKKACIQRVTTAILVFALLAGLQRLVEPKYADALLEGGFTNAYYSEAGGHQVLMVGDCELYENFDPVTLWDNYGIDSYIRGNAQQLPWQSYYLLKEALRYETPEVVVFNVLELKYNEPQKEEYNRLTIDKMKWSMDKWNIIRASKTERESMLEYLFPILRYHARITQLTEEDIRHYWDNGEAHTVAGYYMRIDESPYQIGQWGEENYVGTYTDEHMANGAEADEDAAEKGWSAEADDVAMDESWSAEADDAAMDESWSAEADDAAMDEGWSAEADDAAIDESWSAEANDNAAEAGDAAAEKGQPMEAGEHAVDKISSAKSGKAEESQEPPAGEDAGEESQRAKSPEPLGAHAMHYLDLIRELCEEKGIRLLLVKAPSVSPVWHDAWESQIVEYAQRHQLDYINYLHLIDEIGIDFATDTYDEGLHMNYSGAVKCADYLGGYLADSYQLEDRRKDPQLSDKWNKIKENQKRIYSVQQSELEKNGAVISY